VLYLLEVDKKTLLRCHRPSPTLADPLRWSPKLRPLPDYSLSLPSPSIWGRQSLAVGSHLIGRPTLSCTLSGFKICWRVGLARQALTFFSMRLGNASWAGLTGFPGPSRFISINCFF
jgi:hypothetical protein